MCIIKIHLTPQQLLSLSRNEDIVIIVNGESMTEPANAQSDEDNFFDHIEQQRQQLKAEGKVRSVSTYRTASNRLKGFLGKPYLSLKEVTPGLMEKYQDHLCETISMNTVSFHMRILRAVYNRIVGQGLIVDRHPFRDVYTGIAKTEKRAVDANIVTAVKQLQFDDQSAMAFARDLFLFSFYTRGMSFIDMSLLRQTDIQNGVLTYRRRKTGQTITMRWERQMQEIVDRYHRPGQPYLLPIIRKLNGKEPNQMRYQQEKMNKKLHIIGEMVGADSDFTMYVARHSWASIARQMGVPTDIISQGMGHTSEKTTQIYLKSLGNNRLDEANLAIIQSV